MQEMVMHQRWVYKSGIAPTKNFNLTRDTECLHKKQNVIARSNVEEKIKFKNKVWG